MQQQTNQQTNKKTPKPKTKPCFFFFGLLLHIVLNFSLKLCTT